MNNEKWTLDHFNYALRAAIEKHANKKFLRTYSNKILFNGFWRQGNKQNVCAWLNKATWSDAKTGESGGIKEFASVAFGLSLPEFMNEYGPTCSQSTKPVEIKKEKPVICDLDSIFKTLGKNRVAKEDHAALWLEEARGIELPREKIYSGFENITPKEAHLFSQAHKGFISHRTKTGKHLVAPLRSPQSDKIENLFFRKIGFLGENFGAEEKSRLLPNVGGLSKKDGTPLGFGLPHLVEEADIVVLCEGFADTLCLEAMLEDHLNITVIGSPSAKFLPKWSQWLANNCNATLFVVYHLDHSKDDSLGVGQENAIAAANIYRNAKKRAHLFPWPKFLLQLKRLGMENAITNFRDVGDICQNRFVWQVSFEQLQKNFANIILKRAE